jgi:hypothetical protein
VKVNPFQKVLIIAYRVHNKLTAKHMVEEAMTKALVRKCNNCDKPFLKDGGCNRMKCDCGNRQCYVCEENVLDYTHFADPPNGKQCPLYGDMQEFLKKQVAVAQERMVRGLLKENGELEDKDLRVDTNAGFGLALALSRHRTARHPEYECDICDRSFHRQESLDQHVRDKHTEYDCDICDRSFGTQESLDQHVRHSHPIEYDCDMCERSFHRQESLDQHVRDKHPEYDCDFCDRLFRTQQSLDQHVRDKHGRWRRD